MTGLSPHGPNIQLHGRRQARHLSARRRRHKRQLPRTQTTKTVKKDDIMALTHFGDSLVYSLARLAEKNEEEAAVSFLSAAKLGEKLPEQYSVAVSHAQYFTAVFHAVGIGLPKCDETAAKWMLKAAKRGMPKAQFETGLFYLNGKGVAKDPVEAARWLTMAAEQGLPEAQCSLGIIYKTEFDGMAQKPAESFRWLMAAAEHAIEEAQVGVAECYFEGFGVEQNKGEAFRWYSKAAEQGNADAQHNLSLMLYNGTGTKRDLVFSYAFMKLASANREESRGPLRVLAVEMLPRHLQQAEEIARNMGKEIAEARKKKEERRQMEQAETMKGLSDAVQRIIADCSN